MSKGLCDPIEVQRFLNVFPKHHPEVQKMFEPLRELYAKGDVTYNERGPVTEFNLRYRSHPTTNLSEANAADGLYTTFGDNIAIKVVTDMEEQKLGHDLCVTIGPRDWTVSVKLADINPNPEYRSFTLHPSIQHDLLHKDRSDYVIYVDNRRRLFMLTSLLESKIALRDSHSTSFGRIRVFYDKFKSTRPALVQHLNEWEHIL